MRKRYKFQYLNLASTVWYYLDERRWHMIAFYAMSAIAVVFISIQPYAISQVINALQRNDENLVRDVVKWLCIYTGMIFLFWSFHGPARCWERSLAFFAKRNFYQDYYRKLTKLPVSWHTHHHSGNTINRIHKAASSLADFGSTQFIYVQSIVRGSMALGILALIDFRVTLVLIVFSALILSVLRFYDKIIIPADHNSNEKEHAFSSTLFDYVTNLTSVISFNLPATTTTRLKSGFMAIWPFYRRSILFNEAKWCTAMILISVVEFTVLIGYIYFYHAAGLPLMIGTVVAIYQYMQQLNRIFYDFASFYQQLIRQNTNINAVTGIDEDFDALAVRDEKFPPLQVKNASIEFRNIDFHYAESKAVFKNLNLTIPGGQKVGLVGHSGAGKTSLVSLLLRFYEPYAGQILIDGQDLTSVTLESQRTSVAVIPQDISLFEDTLMENIRFGRLDATDSEVMAAAEQANAHEFILALPDSYNTYVGERGVRLSGGQRQRIAIARAILRGAPLLILDEATSSLDSHSESLIQQALKNLMQGRTVIAIAHRLSTIAHLDRLIVMDGGRVVEDGTHAGLLARGGLYAQLWNMQSGGFLGE